MHIVFSKFYYLGFFKVQYLGHFYSKTDLLNFADDNTISATETTIEKLISTLEQDSQAAIDWFKINEMMVNPDKFQAITVKKNCRMKDSYVLNINNQTINSENCVKRLGIKIDNTLSFNKHIFNICKKSKQSTKCDRKNSKVHGLQGKRSALKQFRPI